ncbi:MAG: phosphohistidine phosphatase SixA [Candidatus Eisenbacteria bacterium]|uniref:Phosphohistidine phosphatase SixA n=1 Tax=Eiseniibacteriota bacterium TaxID=2212470 RepID=A0A849SHY1_UNCEI|nr:phosphohistidine phosphatase SixA [Candidatus Eisenbacteria bacterium]
MRIILFRHGPAGSRDAARWPDDADRPLTQRGTARTRASARGLARLAGPVTRIYSSPLERARHTAELLRTAHGLDAPIEYLDALAPGGSFREVLKTLSDCEATEVVALVGHEPDLGKLAAILVFGAPATTLALKKAGACTISFIGAPAPGEGRLTAFLPPRLLREARLKRSKA